MISYANKPFFQSQKKLAKSALCNGVDKVVMYSDLWVRSQKLFYNSNKIILNQKRGNGYWLWKPYIILDALNNIDEDDILIYADSGVEFLKEVTPLVHLLNQNGILLFKNNEHLNFTWTKRDCFILMSCDSSRFHFGPQISASCIMVKKNKLVLKILNEWLYYATNEKIITDEENVSGYSNLLGFIDHRHDQSILSLLSIKYQIELFRDPSQWGNHYKLSEYYEDGEYLDKGHYVEPMINSPYFTILNSHRKKIPLSIHDYFEYAIDYLKYFAGFLTPKIYVPQK